MSIESRILPESEFPRGGRPLEGKSAIEEMLKRALREGE